jgi:hypothetical protein
MRRVPERRLDMCYERYWRRRREEAEESQALWEDFERARLISDFEPADEDVERDRTEVREETTTAER